jgi:hypothetical protein
MKKILLVILSVLALGAYSQIVKEDTYNTPILQTYAKEDGTLLYFYQEDQTIRVYNEDHSIAEVIDLSGSLQEGEVIELIGLASDHLFDLDADASFNQYRHFRVADSDGSIIFEEGGLNGFFNIVDESLIKKASDGSTKMVLREEILGKTWIYSLPGNAPLITSVELGDIDTRLYPNPADSQIVIAYQISGEGEVVIRDNKRTVVGEFRVDGSFSDLIVDVSRLVPGTYYYSIIEGEKISTKSFVVV